MYTSLLKNQTIILPESIPQTSIKLDVAAIQDIGMGTRVGVVLLDGNFWHVSQETDEKEWILRSESYLFTSKCVPVQSDADSFTLSGTESERHNV